jgi:hypothetical protein
MGVGGRAALRRLPVAAWLLAVALALIGTVAVFGGFAPAPDRGRPVEVGEEIALQRWRVHVDRAALVDDSYEGQERDPRIRVSLRLEFVGAETECCLSEGLFEVRYAGQAVTRTLSSPGELRSALNHDPGVDTTRSLDFPLEAEALPGALPGRVEVVVRDERPGRSLILQEWVVTHAVAAVDLRCPDQRTRR